MLVRVRCLVWYPSMMFPLTKEIGFVYIVSIFTDVLNHYGYISYFPMYPFRYLKNPLLQKLFYP